MRWNDIYEILFISLGLIYSLLAGHHWTSKVVNRLWSHLQEKENITRPFAYTAEIVGHIERGLYFFAILLGFEEFIAAWLVLKVAGKWVRWEQGTKTNNEEKEDIGRVFYNTFLIGSGLSVGFAFVGVNLVYLLLEKKYEILWISPVALCIGCENLYYLILKKQDDK